VALARPERTSAFLVRPLIAFAVIASPVIALMNGAANAVLRLFGLNQPKSLERAHSSQELRLLVMHSRAHGALDE
jgi:CBS domain containing-hemolysin-like protein